MGIKEKREYHVGRGQSIKYNSLQSKKPIVLYNGRASVESKSIHPNTEKKIISFLENTPSITFKKIEREGSLCDLVALIDKADLVITVDTGISHIASALSKSILIDSYSNSVAPITPFLIKKTFTSENISSTLKSFFSTFHPSAV